MILKNILLLLFLFIVTTPLISSSSARTISDIPLSSRKSCKCKAIYKPVCCKTSSGLKIVSNRCRCICDGGIPLPKSRCRSHRPCFCWKDYKPVCCKSKAGTFRASNRCDCACSLGFVVPKGCSLPKKK